MHALGFPHAGGARKKVYETTATQILGWSRDELRALPHQTTTNPHHRSGPPSRLYDPCDLLAAKGLSQVQRNTIVLWFQFGEAWHDVATTMIDESRAARRQYDSFCELWAWLGRKLLPREPPAPRWHPFIEMWSALGKAYASDALRAFDIEPPPRATARVLRDLLAAIRGAS